MPARKLNEDIIRAAIEGFESQKRRINDRIGELTAMLSGNAAHAPEAAPRKAAQRKRRRFSIASRRKMAEAQRQRWAKIRGESKPAQSAAMAKLPKPKRRISKEGMARIIAATKARWARVRAEKARAAKKRPAGKKKPATKKTAPVMAKAAS